VHVVKQKTEMACVGKQTSHRTTATEQGPPQGHGVRVIVCNTKVLCVVAGREIS